ncbi:hypothetical protein D3C81_2072990 [compost metagenome]
MNSMNLASPPSVTIRPSLDPSLTVAPSAMFRPLKTGVGLAVHSSAHSSAAELFRWAMEMSAMSSKGGLAGTGSPSREFEKKVGRTSRRLFWRFGSTVSPN